MKTDSNGTFSNLLLPGTILLANIDVTGLFVYGLKALLGGGVWLAYKVVADRMEKKSLKKNKRSKLRVIRNNKDAQ
jgi:hypothetical protein